MDLSEWFHQQLQSSAEGFIWGVEQVPAPRRTLQPPAGLGEWTAARHVFHLLFYEQNLALPSMRQWLGDAAPSVQGLDEDAAWAANPEDLATLIAQFKQVRAGQVALLPQFTETLWNETRPALWGQVTLSWVVSKTYQHTAEHTSDVLKIALFWEVVEARQRARGAA